MTTTSVALRQSRRRNTFVSLAMLAPLLITVCVLFLVPLASMLFRSVQNNEAVTAFPRTIEALSGWDGSSLPSESVFEALVLDGRAGADAERSVLGNAARRLNLEVNGFRTLVLSLPKTVRDAAPPYAEFVTSKESRWENLAFWHVLQRNSGHFTDFYYLTAFDLKRADDSSIVSSGQPIFTSIFVWSLAAGLIVTVLSLLIAYPLAHLLAVASPRLGSILMFFVMLPFWTSILVRTSAWIVLLQREGPINGFLQWIGVADQPLALLYNSPGVIIAMVHVMLPFMVLPLYAVMKGVNSSLIRAAYSMGANRLTAFRRVYLPQTYPGIGAGVTLVFILTIGYYITPQLLGGPTEQFISGIIASYTNEYLNWGLASALSVILLAAVVLLFAMLRRFAGAVRVG